jgi:hypothetical protein
VSTIKCKILKVKIDTFGSEGRWLTSPIVAMLVRRASPVVEFIEFVNHAIVRNDQVRDHHGGSDGD